MTAITTTKYSCDFCQKDIDTTGSCYGPLVVTISAPTFWQGAVSGEFCSPKCVCKWIDKKALIKLSGG